MPTPPPTDSAPDRSPIAGSAPGITSDGKTTPPEAPGVLTTLLCERCGNVNLIRVKGCWYCEKCHHKFDCYGW
jgi:hypothetical protein